jgi:hypothetical protein
VGFNWDAGKFWLDMIAIVWAIAITVLGWRISRTRATQSSIQVIEQRVTKMESDVPLHVQSLGASIDNLKTRVSALPNHEDIGKLYADNRANAATLNELVGSVNALVRGFETINTYLLNKEKGGG